MTTLTQRQEAQRRDRVNTNYIANESGKWVRKRAWRECDYTINGTLQEFDTMEAFQRFEETMNDERKFPYYKQKTHYALPEEERALEEAITNACSTDGNETRVKLLEMEEALHKRHDHQDHVCMYVSYMFIQCIVVCILMYIFI